MDEATKMLSELVDSLAASWQNDRTIAIVARAKAYLTNPPVAQVVPPREHVDKIHRLAMALSDGDRPILPVLWEAYELGQDAALASQQKEESQ